MRELIDPTALGEVEDDLAGRSERTRARGADGIHDLLRRLGDLTEGELRERVRAPDELDHDLAGLLHERRAVPMRIGGEARLVAVEDAARYRDGVGAMPPAGLPDALLEPVEDALGGLVARFARGRGPFRAEDVAARLGVAPDAAAERLSVLESDGTLVRGELRPGGTGREWCDAEVLRRLRRASLAALRREVEPAEQLGAGATAARLAAGRSRHGPRRRGRAPRGARSAPGTGPALGAVGGRGAAAAPRRLLADVARRAGRDRRGRVGRRGLRRRRRRAGGGLLPGGGRPARTTRGRRAARRRGEHGPPRGARGRRGLLGGVAPVHRRGPRGGVRGALAARVVGRGHQ